MALSHTELINAFKSVNTAVNATGTFVRGSRQDISLATTKDQWPIIALLPIRENEDRKNRLLTRNIVMAFITQDSTDNTPEQRDTLVEQMGDLASDFINVLETTIAGKVQEIGFVDRTPEYQTYPGYHSGYSIMFKLVSKKGC